VAEFTRTLDKPSAEKAERGSGDGRKMSSLFEVRRVTPSVTAPT